MKIVLGLAGEIASGKGTVGDYIEKTHNSSSYVFSKVLRDVLNRLYQDINRENMQKLSTVLRENFHSDILSEVIYNDVKRDENKVITIDGVRRLADIEYLKKIEGFKLVYIEVDIKKRHERIIKRDQNSDDQGKTFEEFKADNKREAEVQIKGLKDHADIVIDNDGSFEDLYKQVDEIIAKTKQ